jgi:hypothetical protein
MLRQSLLVAIFAAAMAGDSFVAIAQVSPQFDITRTVTIRGTVAQFAVGPAHSYLIIESKDTSGKVETWAVQGDGVSGLLQFGWKLAPPNIRIGDTVAASAFAPKPSASSVEVPPGAPDRAIAAAKEMRFVHGIDVTVGTEKLMFGSSK